MLLYALIACRTESECLAGFTLKDDGMCYAIPEEDTAVEDTDVPETEPPTVEDLLDTLPACEPVATDGRLDIDGGCADGACAGMTYAEMVGALGDDPTCEAFYYEFGSYAGGSVSCTWDNGVDASFDDLDRDGVADPASIAYGMKVQDPFDGGTVEGSACSPT